MPPVSSPKTAISQYLPSTLGGSVSSQAMPQKSFDSPKTEDASRRSSIQLDASSELGGSVVTDLGPTPLHGARALSDVGEGRQYMDLYSRRMSRSEMSSSSSGVGDTARPSLRIDTSPERVQWNSETPGRASNTLSEFSFIGWPSPTGGHLPSTPRSGREPERMFGGSDTGPLTNTHAASCPRPRSNSLSGLGPLKAAEFRSGMERGVELEAQRSWWSWLGGSPRQVVVAKDEANELGTTFPPPDIDEAAGFLGRVEGLGAVLQRLVMGFGGSWALYAAWQGVEALRDDAAAVSHLENWLALDHLAAKDRQEASASIGQRLRRRELIDRRFSWWSNLVLVPGSALMGINLLFAPELAGGVIPALVGLSQLSMAPAVICMAVYGSLVAVKAGLDLYRQYQVPANKLDDRSSTQPRSYVSEYMLARRKSLFVHDWALVATGLMQAAGAVGMWLTGPAWLGVLLPGTLGLGLFKYSRAILVGQNTISDVSNHLGSDDGDCQLLDFKNNEVVRGVARELLDSAYSNLEARRAQSVRLNHQRPFAESLLARVFPLAMPAIQGNVDNGPDNLDISSELSRTESESCVEQTEAIYNDCLILIRSNLFSAFAEQVADHPALPKLRRRKVDGDVWSLNVGDVCDMVREADLRTRAERERVVEILSQIAFGLKSQAEEKYWHRTRAFCAELLGATTLKPA